MPLTLLGFSPSEFFPAAQPVPSRFPNPLNVWLLSHDLELGEMHPLPAKSPSYHGFPPFSGFDQTSVRLSAPGVTLLQNPILSWGFASLWHSP
jgi:hypothetical protein